MPAVKTQYRTPIKEHLYWVADIFPTTYEWSCGREYLADGLRSYCCLAFKAYCPTSLIKRKERGYLIYTFNSINNPNTPPVSSSRPLLPARAVPKHTQSAGSSIAARKDCRSRDPSAKMAPTIEELDATVRAFYEGRGDTVSIILANMPSCDRNRPVLTCWAYSKKPLKLRWTRYGSICARHSMRLKAPLTYENSSKRTLMHGY